MSDLTTTQRIDLLKRCVPELFARPGHVLYVGANRLWGGGMQCVPELLKAGHEITLLEVWEKNAQSFKPGKEFEHIVIGDVTEIENVELSHDHYEAVVWWHGPEHIKATLLEPTLKRLELRADLVVLGCPWGEYPQGAISGNPHDRHLAYLYPADFMLMGYQTETLGTIDTRGSHILAWKTKE